MTNSVKKSRKKQEEKKRKLARRRERLRMQRLLKSRQVDRKVKGTPPPKLSEEAPIPNRNDPCPIHPEHKFKKCPHGCIEMFRRMRHRVADDTLIVNVEFNDPCPMHPQYSLGECPHGCRNRGIVGRERDASNGALEDFSSVLGDLGSGGL